MENKINFKELKNIILYHKIISHKKSEIILDNGVVVIIKEIEGDSYARAIGEFTDIVLNIPITSISKPKYNSWDNWDNYGCRATINLLHNQDVICKVSAFANANIDSDIHHSAVSLIISVPNDTNSYIYKFVDSDDN